MDMNAAFYRALDTAGFLNSRLRTAAQSAHGATPLHELISRQIDPSCEAILREMAQLIANGRTK